MGHETHKTNKELFTELHFDPVALLRTEARNNHARFQALPDMLRLERTSQWHTLLLASLVEPLTRPEARPEARTAPAAQTHRPRKPPHQLVAHTF